MEELDEAGLLLANRQTLVDFDEVAMRRFHKVAVAARDALREEKTNSLLCVLDEIEVTLVDDVAIARVHNEFFQDPNATDVITFEHGEILVSVETARRQAKRYGQTADAELTLYIIHGLAHLAGYDDKAAKDREVMTARQEELLGLLWSP